MGSIGFYEGAGFFFLLVLALLPAIVLGVKEKPLKYYQLAVSVFFICLILGQEPGQFFAFLVFYGLSLFLIKTYLKWNEAHKRDGRAYVLVVGLLLLPLILCKIFPFFGGSLMAFVGISYLTFRNVQIAIEIYDGVIGEVPTASYTAFLLFFPSFSSGPIDRSRRFQTDWETIYKRDEYLELLGDGIYKLLLGLVYKMILASPFYLLMNQCATDTEWFFNLGYAYSYGLYLFFDFAGYSLMAVGTAYILGVRLPDNFCKPFCSIDIKDFWDRWHISLSHWFRDFLFTRFIMRCTKKKWFHNRLQRASAGFLVNMGVMGLWHGLTLSYILYGLYHGILLAGTEVYQKKSGFYKKYKSCKWYQGLSWFVTMQFVFFGFFIFSGRFLEVLGI